MKNASKSPAATLRASLDHPIIDADGHWLEFGSLTSAKMREIGGAPAEAGFEYYTTHVVKNVLALSEQERIDQRVSHPVWWGIPTKNTRDRATVMMPKLLYSRMDEFGVDFSVMYPTAGLGLTRIPDDEARIAACRAFNVISAEKFAKFSDRMTPVAVIPMHTPDEAIAEMEHAFGELGLKGGMFGSFIPRPVKAFKNVPEELKRFVVWRDTLGLDSEYDYDPVWQKCVDMGVMPTFHTGSREMGSRISPTNFVYNHIGHFAAASEAVAKALVIGGVTRRFPTLKFAFQEGGVGWACQLYADMVEHWETRSMEALDLLDPDNLDLELFTHLANDYDPEVAAALRDGDVVLDNSTARKRFEPRDDFAAAKIEKKSDLKDLFAKPFYFGCEADDKTSAWAYSAKNNPFNSKLNTLFGSDIGHFDVSDMSETICEAHELVEKGLITDADYRSLMFENPARFWGESNRNFFKGTVVEKAVDQYLESIAE